MQGVGFRYDARSRARSLEIDGWIRNLPDGAVEAVFEGEDDCVEGMVEWARRGPPGARVDDARVEWEAPLGEAGFTVR